ncbi:sugar ABC transporter ATP-binding protein [Jiella marina]|uniref:sugar ABC transporter ATP-binding protein n=1 Tax=Jiella sp. LLJ827 TaxID=2917712 RepID=UPI002100ABEB|nr:sugar ABC transporter ATP-binding protein [Jiella sp. LLJ827]
MSATSSVSAEPQRAAAVEFRGVSKSFGANKAVDDVSFRVEPGSVHALLGENGAGKSTTMKILSGLLEPDSGHVEIGGTRKRLKSPKDAHRLGIRTAFQELTLIPDLSVLDNMLIPRAPKSIAATLRRGAVRQQVADHFAKLGIRVDLDAKAQTLDLATRQKIEIGRTLYRKPKILLLDEPTSALTGGDVDWLGEIIAGAKAEGVTVLFISHRMPEVRAFCDRMTILRNGQHVKTDDVAAFTDAQVVELIIGRSIEQTFPEKRKLADNTNNTPVLQAKRLTAGKKLKEVDLSLHAGEILGVAGLQGMGQHDLFTALFGETRVDGGVIEVDGSPVRLASPADALHPSLRIGYVPEERKTDGLFLKLSGMTNATLPVVDRFTKGGLIDADAETAAAKKAFAAVEVDPRATYTDAGAFSGGNQQKIAIAKWLVAESRILLLFDPTRGIDVGTKHQLYELMRAFADAGGAILFHSTEVPELVNLSDRVLTLYEGRVASVVEGDTIDEVSIMHAALGGDSKVEDAARGKAVAV